VTRQAFTIAHYTLLEALRNRLVWLFVLAALLAAGLGALLEQLALTESWQTALALMAPALRLAGAALLAAFVVTSQVRESADKGLELLLALPLPRSAYVLGKLAGYAALALLPALLYGALCWAWSAGAGQSLSQCLLWTLSLWCELCLVAGFALLAVLGLGQALPALATSAGFYLLARSIGAMQLLSHGAAGQHPGPLQRALGGGVDLVAALLPPLDRYTRTDWLLYHSGDSGALWLVLGQSAVYVLLLACAALVDLYRKAL